MQSFILWFTLSSASKRKMEHTTPLTTVNTNRTSPALIRKMSTSPGKRSRRASDTSTVSLVSENSDELSYSYTSSEVSVAPEPARVQYRSSVTVSSTQGASSTPGPATKPKPKLQSTTSTPATGTAFTRDTAPASGRSSKVLALAKKLEHKLANPGEDTGDISF